MQQDDMNGRSRAEIEADLDRDRADLAASIDGLRDRLSVDALLGDAMHYAQGNMGTYVRALDGAVRAHPLAAVMAGVGIAWLLLGRRARSSVPEVPLAGTKFEALSRWEDEGGPPAPLPEPDQSWITATDTLRHRATAALARIDEAARARLRPAADIARDRATVLAHLARETRTAMLHGAETLAAGAQERILAAREKAYAARMVTARQGAKLIEEQPMIAGAIGMAIGAAVAAALPRTEAEDRLFGDERDRLMAEARHALQMERARAAGAASALAATIATEVKDTARKVVADAI